MTDAGSNTVSKWILVVPSRIFGGARGHLTKRYKAYQSIP